MMQLGSDGVFVGSGIYSADKTTWLPRARAIVQAVAHYDNPLKLAEISTGLGEAMSGMAIGPNMKGGKLSERGW